MIYLDNAATTPVKHEVLQAMLPYFSEQYANASSLYSAARNARRAIDHARKRVSALIGAAPGEVFFTSGGSEADNWALLGAAHAFKNKKHIITSSIEHPAVLRTCEALEDEGYQVSYLPVDSCGLVNLEALKEEVNEKTALISVMLANNEVGTIQPIREISQIAHRHGILIHTDAVQAAGHIPIDVSQLGVDLLSLSAHKFYGPKGIGALYIRKGVRINRMIMGGEQERGMRAGTENTAAIVGMGKAAELALTCLEKDTNRIRYLRDEMIAMAKERLPGVRINGEFAKRLPGHVHMTLQGADPAIILMQLDMMGIAASSGSACAAGAAERSHVMKAMGIQGEHEADIRFTLGEQNTLDDINQAISALASILQR